MGSSFAYPTVDQAISQFEGYGTPNATTINNANNPGAITFGQFAIQNGATGFVTNPVTGQQFAFFPDQTTGYQALDNLVAQKAANGATIDSLISSWSPPTAPGNTPANTQNYINYVANQNGVSPDTLVSSLASNPATSSSTTPSTATPASTSASNVLNTASFLCSLTPWLSACKTVQQATAPTSTSQFSFGRIGAFVLGLIAIAGAIYLFKEGSPTVQSVSRAVGRTVARV